MIALGQALWRAAAVLALALPAIAAAVPGRAQTVATYHGNAARSGNFVMPDFTWDRARLLQLDSNFAPRFTGHLYAQPLYWRQPGQAAGVLVVASESNNVAAIDAVSGRTLWQRSLGSPVPLSTFPCGNIDPLGITGTPVIDETSATLYLDAMVADPAGPRHKLFALSLANGATVPGWPIDVAEALRSDGPNFDSRVQNQRAALALLGGNLYVAYGGFFGDCGDYHGWIVGVSLKDPRHRFSWRTRGGAGGIWAPGGIASDGASLYAATGNTIGARQWSDGNAVFRLRPDLRHSVAPADFFAPTDWRALDERDADLGGSNPLLFDLPNADGGSLPAVLALGKDGRAYLLDRRNLGGIGGALVTKPVSTQPIRTSPAVYPAGDGVDVAFHGRGANCPPGQRGDLTVLRLAAGAPAAIATAWCGRMSGAGAPIVTTTDGQSNPIVWILGTEGDNRLHGFRGDTGEALFSGPPLRGLRHFETLIAADGRLFVGADGGLYAFAIANH
jgi:outer membrane protein assembly factor BamB